MPFVKFSDKELLALEGMNRKDRRRASKQLGIKIKGSTKPFVNKKKKEKYKLPDYLK